MKTLLVLLIGTLLTTSAISQTLDLKFEGANNNRNYQVVIDGNSYYSNDATADKATRTITIPNLGLGSHTLVVYRLRANQTTNTTPGRAMYSNNFTLREGYDMTIAVRPNGSVSFSEKRIR